MGLRRVTYTEALGHVKPPTAPQPFALLLDDGTQCRLRNGGGWGVRDDGLAGAYRCSSANLAVLVPMRAEAGASAIDRSQPISTVKTDSLGAGDQSSPQTQTVKTAWLVGS
jgi:hypothetical protein